MLFGNETKYIIQGNGGTTTIKTHEYDSGPDYIAEIWKKRDPHTPSGLVSINGELLNAILACDDCVEKLIIEQDAFEDKHGELSRHHYFQQKLKQKNLHHQFEMFVNFVNL